LEREEDNLRRVHPWNIPWNRLVAPAATVRGTTVVSGPTVRVLTPCGGEEEAEEREEEEVLHDGGD
jgi:hypothetical protein